MSTVRSIAILYAAILRLALADEQPQIALILENTTQKHCIADKDVARIEISGRFRYQNVSTKPILLLRHSHMVEYVRLRPEPRGPSQKAEYSVSSSAVLESLNPAASFTEGDFIRLLPNESYSEQRSFSFPFQKRGKFVSEGLVSDGIYGTDVLVSVWPDTREEADRIAKSLGGTPIAIQPVWSSREKIEVRSDSLAAACP